MRNFFIVIVVSFSLFSCGDGVEFNTPTFQGIKDGAVFWNASGYNVNVDVNGFLIFIGNNSIGTLTLKVPSVSVGTYVLGNVPSMEASFQDSNTLFSTNNIGNQGPFNFSDGEIVIEEIDFVNNIFTGTFRFNAFDSSGLNSVNFIEGVFHQLPLSSGTIPATIITCFDVQLEASEALTGFQNVDTSNPSDYFTACEAYRLALETQKTYCGDADGALQDIIDALGNCIL